MNEWTTAITWVPWGLIVISSPILKYLTNQTDRRTERQNDGKIDIQPPYSGLDPHVEGPKAKARYEAPSLCYSKFISFQK